MPSVAITTLVNSSGSIILEIAKLGYSVSLWSSNNPYIKTLNGPGGLVLLEIERKISSDEESAKDLVNKLSNMLKENEIPYFSLVVFSKTGASANAGNLKPKKPVDPATDKSSNNVKEIKKKGNLTLIK